MPPAPSACRKRLPSEQRRQEIIVAAVELAGELGPASVTTQAIADRIGVRQGALFRHFASKDDIWLAAFAWVREQLGGILARAAEGETSPLRQLEAIFVAHVGFVTRHPGVARVLFHSLQNVEETPLAQQVRSVVGAYRGRLVQLFEAARASGEAAAALDPPAAAILFIGAIQGLVIKAALLHEHEIDAAQARAMFALLTRGFAGPACH